MCEGSGFCYSLFFTFKNIDEQAEESTAQPRFSLRPEKLRACSGSYKCSSVSRFIDSCYTCLPQTWPCMQLILLCQNNLKTTSPFRLLRGQWSVLSSPPKGFIPTLTTQVYLEFSAAWQYSDNSSCDRRGALASDLSVSEVRWWPWTPAPVAALDANSLVFA